MAKYKSKYNKKNTLPEYDFGGWLKNNAIPLLQTAGGAALTATGVGAPLGMSLMASGATNLLSNEIARPGQEDQANANQLAIQNQAQANTASSMTQNNGMTFGAYGGYIDKYEMGGDLTEFQGPSHDEGGITLGQPGQEFAEVEGKETKKDDYIFSERLKDPRSKKSFAQLSKSINKKFSKRPDDKMSKEAKEQALNKLKESQEMMRHTLMSNAYEMAYGGNLPKYNWGGTTEEWDPHVGKPIVSEDIDSIYNAKPQSYNMGPEAFDYNDYLQALRPNKMSPIYNHAELINEDQVIGRKAHEHYGLIQEAGKLTSMPVKNLTQIPVKNLTQDKTGERTIMKPTNHNPNLRIDNTFNSNKNDIDYSRYLQGAGYAAQLGTSLYNYNKLGKNPRTSTLPRAQANLIDDTSEQRRIGNTFAGQRKSLKDMGAISSGQLLHSYGNSAALEADARARTGMDKHNTNAQILNQTSLANAQIGSREIDNNHADYDKFWEAKARGLNNVGNIFANINKDYNATKTQDSMIRSLMGTNEYKYVKNPRTGQYEIVHSSKAD
jgi:hypothetical protein